MASAVPTASSTKETTNYARLCRLLVDIGTQALRDTLDAIHPPANLHAVLAGNIATLQPLRARRIINPIQWGKLFPAIPTLVSSRDFDTTLLMVLLRNLCGLTPPPLTGWDAFPALTDLSREADIARVKYFRNTVYGHAETASVDETMFNDHWRDIRDPLVRLGGVTYEAAIDNLRNECMDPEVQDHCKELLSQWKKDDDNVKEQVDEIKKRLDALTASKEPTADKETVQGLAMCKESYHENEALEYYCQQCKVCICIKCGQTRHNHHEKVDIQQGAEQVLEKAKAEVVVVEGKINKQIELRNKSEASLVTAQNKLTETVEEVTESVEEFLQFLRDHETETKNKLIQINETQERDHVAQLQKFQLLLTELNSSIERGDDMFQRGMCIEIIQEEQALFGGCEEHLTQKMEVYKSDHINYVINKGRVSAIRRLLPLGQVVASGTDHSQSVAEGKGLKKAQMDAETKFTITTRDSDGKQFHEEQDQVTVTVSSSTGDEEVQITDCKDGKYIVHYKPKSVGRHDVAIEINGWPLTGSPWSVNVTAPHRYRVALSFGSRGERQGEFNGSICIAKNEIKGNIAVADYVNKRIQLFDKDGQYIRTIGGAKGLPTGAVNIGHAISVAFSRDGDIIVIHGDIISRKMSSITARGQFIEHFSEHVIEPRSVFVKTDADGDVIVCDGGDNKIKVLSPDGAELLQSFSAAHCARSPNFAFYYHDMFFVSYYRANCVKVFNKDGVFLYDIGSEGSGDEQLCGPTGLAVDAFDNLIVCDYGNKRLKVFTLEGTFLTLIDEGIKCPVFVTVCNNGDVLVTDEKKHCILVLK